MAEPVNPEQVTEYVDTAYRSDRIPVMPPPVQTQYENVIPHCPRLAWGNYQYLAPLLTFKFQLQYAKGHDNVSEDEKGFPWNHQYLNESTGAMALLVTGLFYCKMGFFLLIWVTSAVALIMMVTHFADGYLDTLKDWWLAGKNYGALILGSVLGYAISTPLHRWVSSRAYDQFKSDPTGYYRRDGMVRIRRKDGIFEAPFYEFDPYVEKVPFRGSWDYKLLLQHRYQPVSIRASTGLLGNTGHFEEVVAFWDLLQRFMDVTEPLPDVPMFEPFRHLDPVTVEQDHATGRSPRYWRDMSVEEWKENHEPYERQRLMAARMDLPCIVSEKVQGRGLPVPDVQQNPEGGSLFRA